MPSPPSHKGGDRLSRLAVTGLVAVLMAAAWVGWGPSVAAPPTLSWALDDAPQPYVEYVHVPFAAPVPARRSPLDLRLDELARDVGHLRRRITVPSSVRFDAAALTEEIESIVTRLQGQADVSIHVRDLETGLDLFDYAGDRPLNAASNQKLVTSAAALELLGSEYSFRTRVALAQETLYLVGEGDPTLSARRLYEIVSDVASKVPVAEVRRLVVDDSAFSDRRFGPGYRRDGPGFAYQAPSGALSLDFNTVEVVAYAGRGRPRVFLRPASEYVQVRNRAVMRGGRTRLSATSTARNGKTVVTVRGRMRRGGRPWSVRRRIYHPARYVGTTFAAMLAELTDTEPLTVDTGTAPASAEVELAYASVPLLEVVDRVLAYSSNFGAEQLLRTLGWRMTGRPGDWDNGAEVLRGYWSALGHDPATLHFENGSGLSVRGSVTSRGLVDLVETAYRLGRDNANLIDALAVAGEAGTLRQRLRRSGARVRAKTGTLPGVSALTGVVVRADDTPQVAFSIIINTLEADAMRARRRRSYEDSIVLAVLSACDEFEARRGEAASGSNDPVDAAPQRGGVELGAAESTQAATG
ncbi:MAG: D-alanyl-D-alanine carboxypeptidase/D-alanyl-D-alanine-endopeptidase [Myxococcales bacterium FL481]|nr:MAG: D-alanyl-D-alanine carboxypeptidase/D-alanyl-D-alanine-endopeptidase [Myxococcales bacterium FL481]